MPEIDFVSSLLPTIDFPGIPALSSQVLISILPAACRCAPSDERVCTRRQQPNPSCRWRCKEQTGTEKHAFGIWEACPWRIPNFMLRLAFGTVRGSVSASNASLVLPTAGPRVVPASNLPARHAFGDHYSNVGNRQASSPNPLSSKTASDLDIPFGSCLCMAN